MFNFLYSSNYSKKRSSAVRRLRVAREYAQNVSVNMIRINPDDYDASADETEIDEPEVQVRGRSINAIAALKLAKNILTYLGLGFQNDKAKKLV